MQLFKFQARGKTPVRAVARANGRPISTRSINMRVKLVRATPEDKDEVRVVKQPPQGF